jgi:hypothetical protein
MPPGARATRRVETAAMPRLAFAAVFSGLGLILAVIALLVTDGLTPGRVAPGFAAWGAALGGVLLVGGLFGLEAGRDQPRRTG